MPYRLSISAPIRKSLRRSLASQIDRARAELAAVGDPAPRIHEARKCLKRCRALLRLASSGLASGAAKMTAPANREAIRI